MFFLKILGKLWNFRQTAFTFPSQNNSFLTQVLPIVEQPLKQNIILIFLFLPEFFAWCAAFFQKRRNWWWGKGINLSPKKLCPTFYGNCFVNGGLSRRHSKLNLLTNEYMTLKLEKESFNCRKEGANNCLVTLIQRSISLSATSR